MNPGIGAPELLILVIIALVVVGPKDLPLMVRKAGRFMGKMRAMARDFQRSFDDLGRQAELDELRQEINALKKANPVDEVRAELKKAEAEAMAEEPGEAEPRPAEIREHPRLAGRARGASASTPEPRQTD
ncbi:twin-arginine translocase subunit TatB [Alkalicaulis satelles]|uniref:Sec-independent protein translocase protein TatB n=1 Tax=Alkalicaulis satelles TaxID=2609175 RepID=A0A5M6ZP30_9PROT|nr:Sec-independent protein translocase protein TatB [Alkalicaulis satelles]KAA5804978.1 twin-arginine translocase subunit TatB [Alkalicaulis satelles]